MQPDVIYLERLGFLVIMPDLLLASRTLRSLDLWVLDDDKSALLK